MIDFKNIRNFSLDKLELDEQNLVIQMKLNKLVLNKNSDSKITEYIKDKITIKNIVSMYQVTSIYELPNLAKQTFNCIERCFTMLAETEHFRELDYFVLSKILASSDLHITSELEVFNAANGWLNHNFDKRSKFAKNLQIVKRVFVIFI